jgi:carboxymethylenebutenolidase
LVAQVLPPGAVYHPAGITAYDVTVQGYNSDTVPAYVARPTEDGPHTGLLLVHGIHGYEEHMKDMARRYAALGYAAIVPALYSRDGFLCVVEEDDLMKAQAAMAARPNAQAIGDLNGGLRFLRSSPHVTDRIGLVGFCSGGRLGLVFASSVTGLDVFVNFYSNGLFQSTDVNPVAPGEIAKDLSCPMLTIYGDEDTNPSPDDMTRLRQIVEGTSNTFEFVSYKNAAHAFLSDTRNSYRPETAQMAWGRCLEWLSKYLKP